MTERDFEPTGPLTDVPASRRPHVPSLPPGQVLAERFRIVAALGEGGMGEVYEAFDLELGEPVALKTLRPEHAKDERALELFRNEIQLARRVTHVNVCRTYDLFRHRAPASEGAPGVEIAFVTMELLRGETLAARIRRQGRLEVPEALPIVEQIVDGLSAAHRAGVVHRDLKSDNVLLVAEEGRTRAVVSDFGMAKGEIDKDASPEERIVGTPAYMAPEQVEGRAATPQTDVYALGVMLYEILSGRIPFVAETPLRSALLRLESPPTPIRRHLERVDPRWEAAIGRCLQREPSQRFASVEDVARLLRGEDSPARGRRAAGLVAALVVSLAAAAAWWTLRAPAPAPAPVAKPFTTRPLARVEIEAPPGADGPWQAAFVAELVEESLRAGGRLRVLPGDAAALRLPTPVDVPVSGRLRAQGGVVELELSAPGQTGAEPPGRESGAPAALFDVALRAASRLRESLRLPPLGDEDRAALDALRFSSADAARDYARGRVALRQYDARGARAALEKAVAAEPSHPLVRAALARALSAQGRDGRARDEAQRALDLAATLRPEARASLEAQLRETTREWARAVEALSRQHEAAPDDVEILLRLVEAQTSGGNAGDALETLKRAGRTGEGDPRRDLAEARAAQVKGEVDRARDVIARGVAAAANAAPELQGRAHLVAAQVLRARGDLEESATAALQAVRLFAEAGDRSGQARAQRQEADVRRYQGRLGEALKSAQLSLDVARGADDIGSAASSVNRIASVLQEQGRLREARQRYEEVRALAPDTGDRELEATAMNNVGVTWWQQGDLAAARRYLEGSLAFFRQIASRRGQTFALFNRGFVLLDAGELDAAGRALDESLRLARELGQPSLTAQALTGQGRLARARGDAEAARRLHEEALSLRTGLDERGRVAESRLALGEVALDAGRLDDALSLGREALQEFEREERRHDQAQAKALLAEALLRRGEGDAARREASEAKKLCARTESEPIRIVVALAAARTSDDAGALREAREALKLAEQAGQRLLAYEARLVIARVEARGGKPQALLAFAAEAEAAGFVRLARLAGAGPR
jgi:tetratricopeptide (TPR) repeat protein